jgi:hypothetical protein
MSTTKDEVRRLLQKLPEDCTIEDVQYHLYALEKVRRGEERAEREGPLSSEDVTEQFEKS